jgi:hypothetical protein
MYSRTVHAHEHNTSQRAKFFNCISSLHAKNQGETVSRKMRAWRMKQRNSIVVQGKIKKHIHLILIY